jgi:hypothetical protein
MGNQQSAPPQCQPGCSPTSAVSEAIQAVSSRQPTVTPDPVSQCQANKIKANQLQGELSQVNNSVDSCDPSIPLARRRAAILKENEEFVNQQRDKAQVFISPGGGPPLNKLQDKFQMGNELADAVKQLKQYEKKLKKELDIAEKDLVRLFNNERRYRRDFLDNQPTDGVPWHIFGLQTSDDKVMLTFWITALISFSILAHVGLTSLNPNSTLKERAVPGSISVIAALVVSYLFIIYTG